MSALRPWISGDATYICASLSSRRVSRRVHVHLELANSSSWRLQKFKWLWIILQQWRGLRVPCIAVYGSCIVKVARLPRSV